MKISEVSERFDISPDTLRYYERIGLIHPIDRADNMHRRYSIDDIGWIEFLTKLRTTGMSIQQMKTYAELQRAGDETLPERLRMLKAHGRKVEDQIAVLQEHLTMIHYKIGYYQDVVDKQMDAVPSG